MIELKGTPGELSFTVTVKRKATGKVETFHMIGHVLPEPEKPEAKEGDDDGHPRDSGA